MFEQSHFYPSHITEILSALESCDFADMILKSYSFKTVSDPVLEKIYSILKYPEIHEIPSNTLKTLILQEYMPDFPPIDDNDPGKFRKFSENSIDFISETVDLDLEFSKHELIDSKNFFSFYNELTISTPVKSLSSQIPKTTPRSKNGLKVLSWKVKEIVNKNGNSSYQEVADCLVKELNETELKDEKNIRRRVYDALNVLISVGVLSKQSKKVQPLKKNNQNKLHKIKYLKALTEKYLLLKGLIERNKFLKKSFKSLFLPFSLISVSKQDEKPVKVLANFQRTNVTVKLSQSFEICNSDDLLSKTNIQYDLSWLPTGLESICSILNNSKD